MLGPGWFTVVCCLGLEFWLASWDKSRIHKQLHGFISPSSFSMISLVLSGPLGSPFHLPFRKLRLYLSHYDAHFLWMCSCARPCSRKTERTKTKQNKTEKQKPVPGSAPDSLGNDSSFDQRRNFFPQSLVLWTTTTCAHDNGEKRKRKRKLGDFPSSFSPSWKLGGEQNPRDGQTS